MDPLKIGLFLKELRKEQNLTQGQLAQLLHVSDRTVSRWETGVNLPDLDILLKLSELYSVDIREILEGQRSNAPAATPEVLHQMARYSKERAAQQTRMHRLLLVSASAVVALGVSFMTCLELIRHYSSGGLVLALTLAGYLAYCAVMHALPCNRTEAGRPVIFLNGFLAVIVSNVAITLMHFTEESLRYRYFTTLEAFAMGTIFTAFFAAGVVTWLINRKK